MALISFPTSIYSNNQIPLSVRTESHHIVSHHNHVCCNFDLPFSPKPFIIQRTKLYPRQTGSSLVPIMNAKNSGSGEEDSRSLETVLRLYKAIKNKNISELSEIISDECQLVCNFLSIFQPIQGKKQVLKFLVYLIRTLGNSIEFIVHPTLNDGTNVGVKWRLECNKTHVPLGKGFSLHICQVYHGKVIIRNVEMFMEPLLHIEPLRLKIIGYVTNVLGKMSYCYKDKAIKVVFMLVTLSIILATSFIKLCSFCASYVSET